MTATRPFRPGGAARRASLGLWATVALIASSVPGATAAQAGPRQPSPATGANATVVVDAAFPAPGTLHASPTTGISLRGGDAGVLPLAAVRLTARGSTSGAHSGRIRRHPDGAGITWTPDRSFAPGEQVTILGATVRSARSASRAGVASTGGGASYSFTIAVPAPHPGVPAEAGVTHPSLRPGEATDRTAQAEPEPGPYLSRPDLVPPKIAVTTPATGTAPGLLLTTPPTGFAQGGPLITDDAGEPVWHRAVVNKFSGDLERATYRGKDVLVWFEGDIPFTLGNYRGVWKMVDDQYRPVATIAAGNGLEADMHDIEITAQDTAIVEIYNPIRKDLTAVGGRANAIVLEAVVQEVDVVTNDVYWEWHSLDEVPVRREDAGDITLPVVDYAHLNTATIDTDGNVLVSLRNQSQLLKIDRTTGTITWRLGGDANEVTFTDGDPGPSMQHDIHRMADGSLTYFDNGVGHSPGESRGVQFTLDETNLTATRIREQKISPKALALAMGNVQTLDDGGWFIGWGSAGRISEHSASGVLRFAANVPGSTYRAFREDWHATPAAPPDLAVTEGSPGPGGTDTVHVSWNGATDVATWVVRAGPTPGELGVVATATRTGFETKVAIPANQGFVQVIARDDSGGELGRSAVRPVSPWFDETDAPKVAGSYRPLVGDFSGSSSDDIVWYAPGSAADHLWTSGPGSTFTSRRLPPVNGTYAPLVGDLSGDEHDDILWRWPGAATASLWTATGSGGFTASTVPAGSGLRQAHLLPNRLGKDQVLWYEPGKGAAISGYGPVGVVRSFAVSGTYQPTIGDFDGNGRADIFWYAPGPAQDRTWYLSADRGGVTPSIAASVDATVNGSYLVVPGRYSGPGDPRDDLVFTAPGTTAPITSLWQGNVARTWSKSTDATATSGLPLRLRGARDDLYLLTPGADGTIWSPSPAGPDLYRPSLNSPPAVGAQPIVGDFDSSGESSILWYSPGTAPERLFVPHAG